MPQETQQIDFTAADGTQRTSHLVRTAGPVRAAALFVHDTPAAPGIARALALEGFAVLHFDFAGADGVFDPADLAGAALAMQAAGLPPSLLIGHSLGGAAAVLAARQIPGIACVATLNAPASAKHVAMEVGTSAEGDAVAVSLAGREFAVSRTFLESLSAGAVGEHAHALHHPLLILHAPLDQSVSVDHATHLFVAALHPKSFVGLDKADHMLSGPADADYAADMIAAWARHHVPAAAASGTADDAYAVSIEGEPYAIGLTVGRHHLVSDAGLDEGGHDLGPNPTRLLEAALAACSAMTVRMYARRKNWDLQTVEVRIRPGGGAKSHHLTEVEKRASFTGNLDSEQIARLEEILAKCPVHTMLTEGVNIVYRQDD